MLLVVVSREIQRVTIREVKILHETKVTVTEHKSLNSTKGTITYNNKPGCTQKEICEEVKNTMSRKLRKSTGKRTTSGGLAYSSSHLIIAFYQHALRLGGQSSKWGNISQAKAVLPVPTLGGMMRLHAEWSNRCAWTAGLNFMARIVLGFRNAQFVKSSIHPSLRSAFITDLKRISTLSTNKN